MSGVGLGAAAPTGQHARLANPFDDLAAVARFRARFAENLLRTDEIGGRSAEPKLVHKRSQTGARVTKGVGVVVWLSSLCWLVVGKSTV